MELKSDIQKIIGDVGELKLRTRDVAGDKTEDVKKVLELKKQGLSCAKIQHMVPRLTLYRIQKIIKDETNYI